MLMLRSIKRFRLICSSFRLHDRHSNKCRREEFHGCKRIPRTSCLSLKPSTESLSSIFLLMNDIAPPAGLNASSGTHLCLTQKTELNETMPKFLSWNLKKLTVHTKPGIFASIREAIKGLSISVRCEEMTNLLTLNLKYREYWKE
jgi:hypothetical protein